MTSALAAKATIITQIQALPGLSDYTVTWGMPKVPPGKWILVGRITYQNSSWKTNRQYEENYDIEIGINAILPAGSAQDAETEVVRAQSLIWSAITADPSLGGLAVSSLPTPQHVSSWPSPTGMEGQAAGHVSVTARQAR
jgi:hypothetical protein